MQALAFDRQYVVACIMFQVLCINCLGDFPIHRTAMPISEVETCRIRTSLKDSGGNQLLIAVEWHIVFIDRLFFQVSVEIPNRQKNMQRN